MHCMLCNDVPAMNIYRTSPCYDSMPHIRYMCMYTCNTTAVSLCGSKKTPVNAMTTATLYVQLFEWNSIHYAIARRLEYWLALLSDHGQVYNAIDISIVSLHKCTHTHAISDSEIVWRNEIIWPFSLQSDKPLLLGCLT